MSSGFGRLGGYYYIVISGFCLISVLLVKFVYPETAGVTLEGVAKKFEDKPVLKEDENDVDSIELSRRVDVGPET